MNTKMKVTVDGNFLNYGGVILNRAEVSEADAPNGMVIMRNGHQYWLESSVVYGWFADTMDMAKPPVGKGGGKPDAPKKVWIVFHEEHEAGGGTKTKVAHVCDSLLKAEEFDYHYHIKEMEVE